MKKPDIKKLKEQIETLKKESEKFNQEIENVRQWYKFQETELDEMSVQFILAWGDVGDDYAQVIESLDEIIQWEEDHE